MRTKNDPLTLILYTTRMILVIVFFSVLSTCNLSENEDLQNPSDNTILIGDQSLQFVSAKTTWFGPREVTGYQSHYWAYLEFQLIPNSEHHGLPIQV